MPTRCLILLSGKAVGNNSSKEVLPSCPKNCVFGHILSFLSYSTVSTNSSTMIYLLRLTRITQSIIGSVIPSIVPQFKNRRPYICFTTIFMNYPKLQMYGHVNGFLTTILNEAVMISCILSVYYHVFLFRYCSLMTISNFEIETLLNTNKN